MIPKKLNLQTNKLANFEKRRHERRSEKSKTHINFNVLELSEVRKMGVAIIDETMGDLF